jgi:hypothetical protein
MTDKHDEALLEEARRKLDTAAEDPFTAKKETPPVVWPASRPGAAFHLTYNRPEAARVKHPLSFSEETRRCFCGWPAAEGRGTLGQHIDPNKPQVFLAGRGCGPEPNAAHYAALIEFAARLECPNLLVVNLPGSGASVPHHFHAQVWPLVYRNNGKREENALARLMENVEVAPAPFRACRMGGGREVLVSEANFPLWGWHFEFSGMAPGEIGEWLYRVVHCGIRYKSQMRLSYNLFARWNEEPNRVTVLWREKQSECPFMLDEVQALVHQIDPSACEQLRESLNRIWRWGWLEAIGGLSARDDLFFTRAEKFDGAFWEQVFGLITLPSGHREAVCEQLQRELADEEKRAR